MQLLRRLVRGCAVAARAARAASDATRATRATGATAWTWVAARLRDEVLGLLQAVVQLCARVAEQWLQGAGESLPVLFVEKSDLDAIKLSAPQEHTITQSIITTIRTILRKLHI